MKRLRVNRVVERIFTIIAFKSREGVIKRKLAILLLTVSSILLLAHGVFPHHHHGTAVCFKHSHCIPQDTNHDINSTGHSHDNKTPDNEEYCILNQVFITPTNQARPELSQLSASDDFSGVPDSFSAVLAGDLQLKVLQSLEIDGQPPFPDDCLRREVSSLSLRAPPTV